MTTSGPAAPLDASLRALAAAGSALVERVERAGRDAVVPTCPGWDAHRLLAHQARVHRWAHAHVTGGDPSTRPHEKVLAAEEPDLPAYYRAGLELLVSALRSAPPDLHAMTFLRDPPPPREFWARRQSHETTIHGVDALAAELGRRPLAEEAGVPRDVAVDGLDELLVGFVTRDRYPRLVAGEELTILVAPDDADAAWLLRAGAHLTTERTTSGGAERPDATFTGTAAQLYLGLWNRGAEVFAGDRPDLLERWHATQRVRSR